MTAGPATDAERKRAWRYRRKLRRGDRLTPSQQAWLDAYARERETGDGAAPREPEPEPEPPRSGPEPEPEPPRSAPEPLVDLLARDAAPEPPEPPHRPERCPVPDCPHCKAIAGGVACGTTGKRVYPPMTQRAARGIADILLWLIGMGLKLFRSDRQFIPPTEDEKARLAAGIQEMQRRRASALGAFDDIILVFGAIGGYAARASAEPAKLPKPTAEESQK